MGSSYALEACKCWHTWQEKPRAATTAQCILQQLRRDRQVGSRHPPPGRPVPVLLAQLNTQNPRAQLVHLHLHVV